MAAGLANPLPGHPVTQPFGPSTIAWEPEGYYQANAGGPFRFRLTAFLGGTYHANIHTGQDRGAPVGTPVLAPATGRVIADKIDPASGDHYCRILINPTTVIQLDHLSRFLVPVGGRVMVDSRVALSGASGHVTGPHLHWEVRHYVGLNPRPDPALCYQWFRVNPARCLVGGDLAGAAWLRSTY